MKKTKKGIGKQLWKQRELFLMLFPGLLFYLVFRYGPIYGIAIAFQNYSPFLGVEGSEWVGLKHFKRLFSNELLPRLLGNTLRLGVLQLSVVFLSTIIFALILNEVRHARIKKIYQTVSFLPSFLSLVIICSIFTELFSMKSGVINQIITALGGEAIYFNGSPKYYFLIYILSDVWTGIGSGSIVYLAALSGVDQNLYEAAALDGCSRLKRIRYITIPCIMPTIITMFLLSVGGIIRIAPDKTILLYNDLTRETADIIGSYVYRVGLIDKNYSFSTAVGLVESVLASIILVLTNYISKRKTGSGLW